MNAVGIDVSKEKAWLLSFVLMVRSFQTIEVKHTVSGIRSLIEQIQSIDANLVLSWNTPVVITNLLSVNFRKLTFL